jgi:hypothetical protein
LTTDATQIAGVEADELLSIFGGMTNDDTGGGGNQREGVLPTEKIEITKVGDAEPTVITIPSFDQHKHRPVSDELNVLYCPKCGQRAAVQDINKTMGGKVYRIVCSTHGIIDVELWN